MRNKITLTFMALTVTAFFVSNTFADDEYDKNLIYKMKAKNAHLIRHVTGDVVESIRGVPAIPVDSFLWSGENIKDINGHAELKIDPVNNTGKVSASWHDEYGHWTYKQNMFVAPPHPSGVKLGSSINDVQKIMDDPVTTNAYLHGDTGAGGPVIPTVFNMLATWGPAKVTLNDEVFPNTFDDMNMWPGHTMISEGVRDDEGVVRTTSGEIFNMMKRAEGVTYSDKLTFHLVFHSMPGAMTANIPPPVGFFYHVSFSDVKVKVKYKN
ncbi:MAG TPA: hypothetical protein ENJ28_00480 [Gammaproteobacteria bacterium]|nr:hypothetical protein [Gammaproteobacteria bacterium]